jgi:hypothetical protein
VWKTLGNPLEKLELWLEVSPKNLRFDGGAADEDVMKTTENVLDIKRFWFANIEIKNN